MPVIAYPMQFKNNTHNLADTTTYIQSANRPYCRKNRCFIPDIKIKKFQSIGKASWYGRPFHGRKTSSGEHFNMFAYTAASTTLPIPSYAKITHLKNKKSIIVRINDRGPFIKGRLIDLSYGAAHKLGFSQHGIADVYVEWIHPKKYEYIKATMQKKASQTKELPIYNLFNNIKYFLTTTVQLSPQTHSISPKNLSSSPAQHNFQKAYIKKTALQHRQATQLSPK